MKMFAITLASGLILAGSAFADSVTIQTNDRAGVAVATPVAEVPAPAGQQTFTKDKIKESDDGMKREEKRTTETVGPNGSSKTTTKVEQKSDDD